MSSIAFFARQCAFSVVCAAALVLEGCGSRESKPELAKVTGVVTLDGSPLSDAVVSFTPKQPDAKGHGGVSNGGTDKSGAFTLLYGAGLPGAIIGEHTVQISKLAGTPDVPGGETLPDTYNVKTQLTETVTASGPNHFEFKLVSRKQR